MQTAPPSVPPALRPAAPNASQGPAAPRDTLEYRTALELELWKEEQEDLFDDQVGTPTPPSVCRTEAVLMRTFAF